MNRLVTKLAVLFVACGSIAILMSMFVSVADVVGTMLGRPVPGALEFTESTMVLVVFGGITFAQIRHAHIRVELFYFRVGPKMKSVMDLITSLAGIVFFSLIVWQGGVEALYSFEIREATSGSIRFPLWPARWLLVIGSGLMIVQLLLDTWRDLTHFGNPRPTAFG
ncbi:TRAP transporter small permease subunit [Aliihoeflea aestuarii]|uniref:TRAP transporter small permease subunit n=1 Tax=Aliihoeflea aestuarii TaxID=453840 RepID=UPI002091FF53|nr:TRAP transporter small permease [Aliihoeflea aestuarii]MCO6390091.1 TRAP transporter small permease subunit [Aliihoeflea aestuarii]